MLHCVTFIGTLYLGGPARDGRSGSGWYMRCKSLLPFVPERGMLLGPNKPLQVEAVTYLGVRVRGGETTGANFECLVTVWNTGMSQRGDYLNHLTPEEVMDLLRSGRRKPEDPDTGFRLKWEFAPYSTG